MSERCETARRVHDVDHVAGQRTGSWYEGRTLGRQPPLERLACVCDVSSRDHRSRNLRPANGTAALLPRLSEHRRNIDRHPEFGKTNTKCFDAYYSPCPL